jgi:hypothetical protein
MTWGILDTADNCWIGNDSGPLVFTDFAARVAAQVLETQAFGTDLGARYKSREFVSSGLRLKDHIEVRMDSLTALQRIEGDGQARGTSLRGK